MKGREILSWSQKDLNTNDDNMGLTGSFSVPLELCSECMGLKIFTFEISFLFYFMFVFLKDLLVIQGGSCENSCFWNFFFF
jgi:hypothetical protein